MQASNVQSAKENIDIIDKAHDDIGMFIQYIQDRQVALLTSPSNREGSYELAKDYIESAQTSVKEARNALACLDSLLWSPDDGLDCTKATQHIAEASIGMGAVDTSLGGFITQTVDSAYYNETGPGADYMDNLSAVLQDLSTLDTDWFVEEMVRCKAFTREQWKAR